MAVGVQSVPQSASVRTSARASRCLAAMVTGYFVLTELSAGLGLHILVGICGILIMSAVAWLLSWYKHYVDKGGPRTKRAGGKADLAGGSP